MWYGSPEHRADVVRTIKKSDNKDLFLWLGHPSPGNREYWPELTAELHARIADGRVVPPLPDHVALILMEVT